MPKRRAKKSEKTPPPPSKPLKIAGNFDALIRQSLSVTKPKGGWPKPK